MTATLKVSGARVYEWIMGVCEDSVGVQQKIPWRTQPVQTLPFPPHDSWWS